MTDLTMLLEVNGDVVPQYLMRTSPVPLTVHEGDLDVLFGKHFRKETVGFVENAHHTEVV